jgi:hypothetical protein
MVAVAATVETELRVFPVGIEVDSVALAPATVTTLNDAELPDTEAPLDGAVISVGGGVLNPDGKVVEADPADIIGELKVATPENVLEPEAVAPVVDWLVIELFVRRQSRCVPTAIDAAISLIFNDCPTTNR